MRVLSLSVFLLILFSCANTKKMDESAGKSAYVQGEFDKQGHRGCRGLMPENTIPAMIKAIDLGVTTLEMDVVITKDKKVILSHEPWFGQEITTKPDGTFMGDREERKFNIYWMTHADTKTFDVGKKPHTRFPDQEKMAVTKPLLSEVFDAVKETMMTRRRPFPFYNIETKTDPSFDGVFHPAPGEFVELLMGVIKEHGQEEQVIIQSFDFRTLQYLHEHYPHIKTAMLIEFNDPRSMKEHVEALGFTPTIYSPEHSRVDDRLVKDAHKRNMKVIPWTVNTKERIQELKNLKVDGIISDFPNLFNE